MKRGRSKIVGRCSENLIPVCRCGATRYFYYFFVPLHDVNLSEESLRFVYSSLLLIVRFRFHSLLLILFLKFYLVSDPSSIYCLILFHSTVEFHPLSSVRVLGQVLVSRKFHSVHGVKFVLVEIYGFLTFSVFKNPLTSNQRNLSLQVFDKYLDKILVVSTHT